MAELFDGVVEGLDGAVGAGEHDAALHHDEDEGGKGAGVGTAREARAELIDAFADGADPALEVFGDEAMRGAVFGIDLKGKAAEGAAVLAVCLEDALAIAGKDGEDALDGLG